MIDNKKPPQQQSFNNTPNNTNQQSFTNDGKSFMGDYNIIPTLISRSLGSDVVIKLGNQLKEIYKNALSEYGIRIITLNSKDFKLAFSCICVCVNEAKPNGVPVSDVAYHVLQIEASNTPLTPKYVNINNVQTEVIEVPGDGIDKILREKVKAVIQAEYGNGVNIHYVDGQVIPRGFNVDDIQAVYSVAHNAGMACTTELNIIKPNFPDITIAKLDTSRSLSINVTFGKTQTTDIVGLPVRSDIMVSFSSLPKQRGNNVSINAGDREEKYTLVTGFMDLVKYPVNPRGAFGYRPLQTNVNNQTYVARYIMTSLDTEFAYTRGSVLLALLTSYAVQQNGNWMQAFKPVEVPSNQINLYDIGKLNVEANYLGTPGKGDPVDTTASSFNLPQLGEYLNMIIRPEIAISIDIPDAGPMTWFTSVFKYAAIGNIEAINLIIHAADQLTNGRFSQYFKESGTAQQGIALPIDKVHLGYYEKNGVKRDIRDWDYLAIGCAYIETDISVLEDWSDTFTNINSYPTEQRLWGRKRILNALMPNQEIVITGYATRVTFTNAFLISLLRASNDCGLMLDIKTPMSTNEFTNQRGIGDFLAGGMLSGQTGFNFPTSQQGWSGYGMTDGGRFKI